MLISKKFFPALIGAYQDGLICGQWSCLTIPLSALHQQLFLQGFFFPMHKVLKLTPVFCGWLFSPSVNAPVAPDRSGFVLATIIAEHGRPEIHEELRMNVEAAMKDRHREIK